MATNSDSLAPDAPVIDTPEFNDASIGTWFAELEELFRARGVDSDRQRFNTVVVALRSRAWPLGLTVARCIEMQADERYETLKKTVQDYFQAAESQRMVTALSGVPLAGRKPSVLLAEMRTIGGSEAMVSEAWLKALPEPIRNVMNAIPTASLDERARAADEVVNLAKLEEVKANRRLATMASMDCRFDAISDQLEEILTLQRGPAVLPPYTPARGCRPTPSSSEKFICWFHKRFGSRAKRCQRTNRAYSSQCIFYRNSLHAGRSVRPHEERNHFRWVRQRHQTNAPRQLAIPGSQGPLRMHIRDRLTGTVYLVDTGADMSAVPATDQERDVAPSLEAELCAANGSIIATYGTKQLTVDLGLQRTFPWTFVIADVQTPIVGADFLKHFDLLVDLNGNKLIDNSTPTNQTPSA